MELCTCSKCVLHTFNRPNGPTHGRFLSTRNKQKHQDNDWQQLQTLPIRQASSEPNSSNLSSSSLTSQSSSSEDSFVLDDDQSLPVALVAIFICWLHFFCALSLQNCHIVYKFLQEILIEAHKKHTPLLRQTWDLRTMKKSLKISPKLKPFVCYSTCCSLYNGKNIPMTCTYQPSQNNICKNNLFKPTTTFNALQDKGIAPRMRSNMSLNEVGVINTPSLMYYTRDLVEWIKWLLNLETIESEIENWKNELTQTYHTCNIQQSLAWKTFSWSESSRRTPNSLLIAFSLFIDWFSPQGNKIAGKQESLGCLVLTCLNLPPQYRNKPDFTLLYSIIPGPSSPDVITILNILKPLVDELLVIKNSCTVKTQLYPEGRDVYAQLLPLVGDHVAIQ
ncbi:hypothetical protein O181_018578 [Austropuccinia psidii MF-1]|uniref:Uncharacterized protein n=1 Tax=Austropuccinia psidii MF-1 TaxID=1389203 RepID=A0A9Q3C845_9BASI|nr:hypothetical protein [Austropuccinia psidii MF-1]